MLDGARTAERRYACRGYSATTQLKRGMPALLLKSTLNVKARIAKRNETGRVRGRDVNHPSKVAGR
jgi:hypothetical protein